MNIRISFIVSFIIFIIIFYIFLKGLDSSNVYVPKKSSNNQIPIFNAKIFDSKNKITSSQIFKEENYYLMNIWASWCVPCRNEHPFLLNLKKERKLNIIGLNYKDKTKSAKNFLNELNNPYTMIIEDEDGTIAIEWGAYGVPESFLIYDGKIIKKIIGPINEDNFSEIKKIVNEIN